MSKSNLRSRLKVAIETIAKEYGRRISQLTSREEGVVLIQAMYGYVGPGKEITDSFAERLREHISGLNGMDSLAIESVFENGVYAIKISSKQLQE